MNEKNSADEKLSVVRLLSYTLVSTTFWGTDTVVRRLSFVPFVVFVQKVE